MDTFSLYSRLPIFMQNWLCIARGHQLQAQRYPPRYSIDFEELIKSEKRDRAAILAYKEEQTFRILDYAYKHCPYYRETFRRAGLTPSDFTCLADLAKFPTLGKEDVRTYWTGLISDEYDRRTLIPYHTSGSTGKALDFYWTRDSLSFYWATVWRGRRRCGIEKGDLHLNFTGKLVVPLTQHRPPYWRYNGALNQYMLNMQHITAAKVPDIVRFLNETDFRFIVGYPSIIYSFCQFVDELGLDIRRVPPVMFPSAEKLYDYQREQIARTFPGIRIMEHYGFSENAASASKCLAGQYHEDYELGHMELAGARPVANGSAGRLIATAFRNYGMPFIRYEVGDTAVFSRSECSCGLHSQVITDIEGRNEDYVLTPEGTRVMRFDYIFKDTRSIREAQVVQERPGAITLVIVRRDSYDLSMERKLAEAVHSTISPAMKVNFEYVDEIPRTKSGKFKAIVSKLPK